MRSWLLAIALASGCCADTYEIDLDTSNQPRAEMLFVRAGQNVVERGDLTLRAVPLGITGSLRSDAGQQIVIVIHGVSSGTYDGQIQLLHPGAATEVESITSAIDLVYEQVCMAPDQNDYGTGRCGDSFSGSVMFSGTSPTLGDVSGMWVIRQVARVVPGTPDC